ncbi:HlyD family secretion protein, partial [Acinetobacter baumannii]|nr:HlyD family secretion protein [Acinetobacter baumannii]
IYRAGERPSAGKPIISLLPPENIKVHFFIPEAKLGKFKIGSKVKLICDGCAEPIAALLTISALRPSLRLQLFIVRNVVRSSFLWRRLS